MPANDPLELLASAPLPPCVFWRDQDVTQIGLGVAVEIRTQGSARFQEADAALAGSDHPLPWFGGFSFEPRVQDGFGPFGALRFVQPRFLWTLRGGRASLSAAGPDPDWPIVQAWAKRPSSGLTSALGAGGIRLPSDPESWATAVRVAQEAFRERRARKVVLSRELRVRREERIEVARLLAGLRPNSPSEASFAFFAGEAAFVGLTPERLVRVRGDRVDTEALAGSSGPDDGAALLSSAKDREEHDHVVEHLIERLTPYAHVERTAEPVLRSLGTLCHLLTPVTGRLRRRCSVLELAGALHPTPAVGGAPMATALELIRLAEGRPRGWYSGGVGYLERGPEGVMGGDLRVALRSALVEGAEARVFVGAGIVPASTAEGEWQETELKAVRLLDALGAR